MRKLQLSFALWAVLVSGIISFCAELPAGLKQRHGCCFIFLNQKHFNLFSHSIILLFFFFLFSLKLPPLPLQSSRAEGGCASITPHLPQAVSDILSLFPLHWYLLLSATGTSFSIKKKDEQPR